MGLGSMLRRGVLALGAAAVLALPAQAQRKPPLPQFDPHTEEGQANLDALGAFIQANGGGPTRPTGDLIGADPAPPSGGAAIHDTAVWMEPVDVPQAVAARAAVAAARSLMAAARERSKRNREPEHRLVPAAGPRFASPRYVPCSMVSVLLAASRARRSAYKARSSGRYRARPGGSGDCWPAARSHAPSSPPRG